jgi:hypothetical protein
MLKLSKLSANSHVWKHLTLARLHQQIDVDHTGSHQDLSFLMTYPYVRANNSPFLAWHDGESHNQLISTWLCQSRLVLLNSVVIDYRRGVVGVYASQGELQHCHQSLVRNLLYWSIRMAAWRTHFEAQNYFQDTSSLHYQTARRSAAWAPRRMSFLAMQIFEPTSPVATNKHPGIFLRRDVG